MILPCWCYNGIRVKACIFTGLVILLTGCVYMPSSKSQKITEVPETPEGCRFLGEVCGESTYSFLAVGLEVAKARAKREAYDLGATHILWAEQTGALNAVAVGRIYRCEARR
jgi:hypothetical protein